MGPRRLSQGFSWSHCTLTVDRFEELLKKPFLIFGHFFFTVYSVLYEYTIYIYSTYYICTLTVRAHSLPQRSCSCTIPIVYRVQAQSKHVWAYAAKGETLGVPVVPFGHFVVPDPTLYQQSFSRLLHRGCTIAAPIPARGKPRRKCHCLMLISLGHTWPLHLGMFGISRNIYECHQKIWPDA